MKYLSLFRLGKGAQEEGAKRSFVVRSCPALGSGHSMKAYLEDALDALLAELCLNLFNVGAQPKVISDGLDGLFAVQVSHYHTPVGRVLRPALAAGQVPRVPDNKFEVLIVIDSRTEVLVVVNELLDSDLVILVLVPVCCELPEDFFRRLRAGEHVGMLIGVVRCRKVRKGGHTVLVLIQPHVCLLHNVHSGFTHLPSDTNQELGHGDGFTPVPIEVVHNNVKLIRAKFHTVVLQPRLELRFVQFLITVVVHPPQNPAQSSHSVLPPPGEDAVADVFDDVAAQGGAKSDRLETEHPAGEFLDNDVAFVVLVVPLEEPPCRIRMLTAVQFLHRRHKRLNSDPVLLRQQVELPEAPLQVLRKLVRLRKTCLEVELLPDQRLQLIKRLLRDLRRPWKVRCGACHCPPTC
eukprot:Hpha_TRINITY_DN2809_c0_g1::TRINITY_DN2809_c0_g1_i1::g.171507::m.171507